MSSFPCYSLIPGQKDQMWSDSQAIWGDSSSLSWNSKHISKTHFQVSQTHLKPPSLKMTSFVLFLPLLWLHIPQTEISVYLKVKLLFFLSNFAINEKKRSYFDSGKGQLDLLQYFLSHVLGFLYSVSQHTFHDGVPNEHSVTLFKNYFHFSDHIVYAEY